MNHTCEHFKEPGFGPDFWTFGLNLVPKSFFLWILPLLDVWHYCKLSSYANSRKPVNIAKFLRALIETYANDCFYFYFLKNTNFILVVSVPLKKLNKTVEVFEKNLKIA